MPTDPQVWKTLATMLVTAGITFSATFYSVGSGKADLSDVAANTARIEALQDAQHMFQLDVVGTLGRLEAKVDALKEAE